MSKLPLDSTGLTVLKRRFYKKDRFGNLINTPEKLFGTVAREMALIDARYGLSPRKILNVEKQFYQMMANMEFLSGMTLFNAGKEIQQLSACYVLPIEDSLDRIYDTLRKAAFLHKTGAGIGYDFSSIRPQGDEVRTTGGKASGPISFMRLIDFSCETIVNQGATRHAGNMGILRVDHPDIFKFITAKEDYTQLTNFNISVAMTDQFMTALNTGRPFELINPDTGKVTERVSAQKILHQIATSIHHSGEPGLIFIDEINRHNPVPGLGRMIATNQCGEQPLFSYEACNLGSIVLSRMLKIQNKRTVVDWNKFERVVRLAVHFLDNTIDANYFPLPEIEEVNRGNRRIGLGVMGWAEMLFELAVPYNSQEALMLAEKVMKFINDTSHDESAKIAKTRGSFPNYYLSAWPQKGYPRMRNTTTTTIAPNGTTSLVAGCTGGIEPVFSLAYVKKNMETMANVELYQVNPIFERVAKKLGFYSEKLISQIARSGTVYENKAVPKEIQKIFVSSYDILPQWHVKMQAAFQKHTDNAVSKTINLPKKANVESIEKLLLLANRLHCKGLTIYRDQSRNQQVLNLTKKKQKKGD